MPSRTSQYVQVGKRKIELSNLKKVLYPDDGIIKAELIDFYFKLAPTILSHLKGRPLSLVRYPEGITGESFFQKNKPDWAPDWLEHVLLGSGEEKKDYIIATEEASLVWLANLACIEMHQMHSRAPNFDKPDYMVVDFDPPDGFPFPQVAELAMEFRAHAENFGYHPFVKTTGRKGLHVVIPVEPKWTQDEVFEAAKAMAQPFVDQRGSSTTLHISKEYRKGRVLIDIYRNRTSQTIVGAYSVRGLPGAPVSTPLTWEELPAIQHSRELNIHTVPERVVSGGDPWQGIAAFAEALHTQRPAKPVKKKLDKSAHHKTPEQLEEYQKKRQFDKTTEPRGEAPAGQGSAFVVHRHHATRIHYDLRLEKDGVLRSWAVPKGLPPRPGIMRLAVQTEDHPLEYLNFEGLIPKGEYGGGAMWVYAHGKYQVTKEKKNGFYFRLQSKELSAEFRTHSTKDKQWMLERVDNPQVDWLRDPIEPMLAQSADTVPGGEPFVYEVKWDGIRALIALDEGAITIHSRNRMDVTKSFPELTVPEQAFRASGALIDAEIVCLEADGRPNFKNVINRMKQTTEGAVARAKAKHPAVCYVFDLLYLDGRSVMGEPLWRRKEWLKDILKKNTPYRLSESVEDGVALFEAAKSMHLEGIMAKDKNSVYSPGKRTSSWIKVKTRSTRDCVIIGYTKGKGDREQVFGALHIAAMENGSLRYLGKVGSGFDDAMLKQLWGDLKKRKTIPRPIAEKPLDDAVSLWIEPESFCEVQFASLTADGMLREPVFLRLRPDLEK